MDNKIIFNELSYFKTLPTKTRRLVLSYGLRSIAYPILSIFINAFIWRSTGSIWNIAIYNLGLFIALPIGFLINGILLKKINIMQSYFLGLVTSVIGALSVVFLSWSGWIIFLIYGLIYGFGCGLYWSSRNYLDFQETKTKQRNYFVSITSIIASITNISISFIAGWIIIFGETSNQYSPTMAYWFLVIFAFIFVVLSGLILSRTNYNSPVVGKMWQPFISKKWTVVRIVNFGIGFLEGTRFFLPAVLILFFLGKEGVLGTITATVSLAAIILVYIYGRLAKPHHRKPIFIFSVIIHLFLATILAFGNNNISVLIYVLLGGLPFAFHWLAINPWLLDTMDKELGSKPEKKFMLIFDRELFLNIGRIASVSVLFCLFSLTAELFTLRTIPLILSLGQVVIMWVAWKKMKFNS